MKNQYVGDIGDYGKYGLLRFLSAKGVKLGINWYLTNNDGSTDGKHTSYLEKASLRYYDPELFDALKQINSFPEKSVKMIENAGIIPDALFYSELLDTSSHEQKSREILRQLWFNNSTLLLKDAELIFADPDNGMTLTKGAIHKDSEKYILPEEIKSYYNSGHNVFFYCHKGRRKWEAWEQYKTAIKDYIRDARVFVLTHHKGTQRSYIFVIHPDDYQKYARILAQFERTPWRNDFFQEPVNGRTAGQEELASIEIPYSDGATLKLSYIVNGMVHIKSSKRPGETHIITPEMLADYLHIY